MKGKHLGVWMLLLWLFVPVILTGCARRASVHPDAPSDGKVAARRDSGLADALPDALENDGSDGAVGGREPADATERAFRAVVPGTCLPVYKYGEEWNVSAPPAAVSCGSERAGLFQVTSRATSSALCPTGVGRDSWSYYSAVTGNATTLCLNRIWVKNFCVLAEQYGDSVSIGSTTAVGCDATEMPAPYNQVLVVAAVYRAFAGANASHCRTSVEDNRRYWALLANDGSTLVCFTSRF